jgi:hypothetical protein
MLALEDQVEADGRDATADLEANPDGHDSLRYFPY